MSTEIEKLKAAHSKLFELLHLDVDYGVPNIYDDEAAATACTALSVQYAIGLLEKCYYHQYSEIKLALVITELKQTLTTLKQQ
jgi:hypothetical protein